MLKLVIVGLATTAVLWGVYHFAPESTHVAFNVSKYGITYTMLIGAAVSLVFYKIVKGK
jgi:hypothetical protein